MHPATKQYHLALMRLRWQWLAVTLLWGVLFTLLLPQEILPHPLLTVLCFAFCLVILWVGLADNHREGESQLLSGLGLGNHLTLLRGLAISLAASFVFAPRPVGWLAWLPMLLYTFADVADYFDGYLARITHHATKLGSKLDIEFDGLGMLVVTVWGVWQGMLPAWYLLLGVARPWFILGLWWRQRRGKPVYEMVSSEHRRIFAGFQMGFMSAVLWPIIPPEMTQIGGTILGLATGLGFVRDWWTVNGRLDPTNPTFQKHWRQIGHFCRLWLPLGLRLWLPLAVVMIYLPLPDKLTPPAWSALLASWGMGGTAVWATLLAIIGIIGTLLVVSGIMGRLAAFFLVFPIGFDMATIGLTLWNGTATAAVTYLMLLGMGRLALWQPEERFIRQRLGGG
ncbi:MAG: CDP-alcohol phosphatidyltransferase family protein [Ardenticatenaceae bacterium]|nr:CDP-alcohol phosphatidyltransferase family protein [Ardenticatenaceae bacterium]